VTLDTSSLAPGTLSPRLSASSRRTCPVRGIARAVCTAPYAGGFGTAGARGDLARWAAASGSCCARRGYHPSG